MIKRRSYPEHPNRVLASSLYPGLAALTRLAKRNVSTIEIVQSNFEGIEKMWEETREELKKLRERGINDLTPLFNNEPNMRKNYLRMVWYSTVPYGNTEFKRVYRWSQGTIGPINGLLNFAGSQLRTLAMTRFPFPRPSYFQIRKSKGKIQTLPRVTALKHPVKKGQKTQWISIYPGNRRHPDVRVRHPTLPELDFVDMIRAHAVELCRQCFIHNVPQDVAHQKIRLLIHRLTPFLEWKYTEGEHGRKEFSIEADQVLRKIVLELRASYSRRIGKTTRPSQKGRDDKPNTVTVDLFEEQALQALRRDSSKTMKESVEDLRNNIRKNRITSTDAKDLVNESLRISSIEGNKWHRVLGNIAYQPNSLAEVVFYGDKHHRERTNILIAHEVPVATPDGYGVADIVVFVRHKVGGPAIWVPVMVLDIKTKTGIDWNLFGKEPRTEKTKTRVPLFNLVKRKLTNKEWDFVHESMPTGRNIKQLKAYREGLLRDFKKLISHKELIPNTLWTGIIALDSAQSYEDVVDTLPWLIKDTLEDLRTGNVKEDSRTVYYFQSKNDIDHSPRLALFLPSKKGPHDLLRGSVPLPEIVVDDPFAQRVKDDRDFVLYLTVDSPVSSGVSAAWAARNWHLLHHLLQLKGQTEGSQIIWIDLMGLLHSERTVLTRLRLTSALSPKGIKRRVMEKFRKLVESIEFVNLNQECNALSNEDTQSTLERIREKLSSVFSGEKKRQIVVVDGWADRRLLVPYEIVPTLERRLLDWLPLRNAEIIWLDRPVPLPTRSFTYQRPEVSPLPHDSPRRGLLDMIIWNKPVMPRLAGWESPLLEYVRVLEKDTPTRAMPPSSLVVVPHLYGWGRRFRAESNEDRMLQERDVMELVQGPKYARGKVSPKDHSFSFVDSGLEQKILTEASKLSPSILRPRIIHDREGLELLLKTKLHPEFDVVSEKKGPVVSSQGIVDRLHLIPSGTPPRRSRWGNDKSKKYYPASKISRSKIRKGKKEHERKERWTRRPPLIKETSEYRIDTQKLRKAEVLRILRTAEFLVKIFSQYGDDRNALLRSIIDLCEGSIKTRGGQRDPGGVLLDVRDELRNHKESMWFWRFLSELRKESLKASSLPGQVLGTLERVTKYRPDIWAYYGNDLYLLILALHWDEDLRVSMSHLQTLWKAYADWQFVHMGFEEKKDPELPTSKYDVSYIWSNLQWRAKELVASSPPAVITESHRFGVIGHLDENHHFLMFQETPGGKEMVLGIFEERMGLEKRWYPCKLSPFELERWSSSSWKWISPVIITQTRGEDILWTARRDENGVIERWWNEGVFHYGLPPEGKLVPLRWFRLEKPSKKLEEVIESPELNIENDLEQMAKQTLKKLEGISEGVQQVLCRVLLDIDTEVYVVQFCEGGKDDEYVTIHESIEIEGTTDLIQTLRYPLMYGTPYMGKFWWDPRKNIDYLEVQTESGPIDMSFLAPFVYRSRRRSEFLRRFLLPRSVKEVLGTRLGESLTLVADPKTKKLEKPMDKGWRILFLQTEVSERLWALQKVYLNILEVTEFFESRQVFDMDTGIRHPTKITINKAEAVKFPRRVYKYERMMWYLIEKKRLLPNGTHLR